MPKKFWVWETSTDYMSWGKFTSVRPQFLIMQNGGDNIYLLGSQMIHKWMLSKCYSNMEVRVQIWLWKVFWCRHITSRGNPTSTTDPNWGSSIKYSTPIQPHIHLRYVQTSHTHVGLSSYECISWESSMLL